ncbi:MAG: Rne/Rng family ribonuclease [Armatimonadota bacterium]|nr:Rne/Rng family ribonuclease [Armatimonadota bacterium]MCX7777072.1 Rne/Rng family ribonuclease [Armatimonadota bacterium]MDW8024858.1 Rne/Rng family ribonuclease [Armatimonadota bacterium]
MADDDGMRVGEGLLLISVCMGQVWVALTISGRLEKLEVEGAHKLTGNIYKGVVERLAPAIDAAFVKLEEGVYGFLQAGDLAPNSIGVETVSRLARIQIDSLRPGQSILVQVVHEPRGQKCPRLTTRISLRGRFTGLIAQGADHSSVSHTITNVRVRERLLRIVEKYRPLDCGVHVFPEAAERNENEIANDIRELVKIWHDIVFRYKSTSAPSLLYRSPSLIERSLFSMAHKVSEIIIDSPEHYERLLAVAMQHLPYVASRIKLYDSPTPLFDAYGVSKQVETALSKVVKLPSGGYIVIETTEALTSVDVNTGHMLVGDPREIALHVNMEAAEELARQLRIRNISGLIIVDFVDMPSSHSWVRLQERLQRELSLDEVETRIMTLSPTGVVELTRQRHGLSLEELLMEPCEHCGNGKVPSALTIALKLWRELLLESSLRPADVDAVVCAHPKVIAPLLQAGEEELERLESIAQRKIWLFASRSLRRDQFEIAFGEDALKPYLEAEPKEGEQFDLRAGDELYPSEAPKFALFKNKLVRLPEGIGVETPRISFKLERVGRWFAEATWMPSVEPVAKNEIDALKLKTEGGEAR